MSRGIRCQMWLTEDGRSILGEEGAGLLSLVRELGSMSATADRLGWSFLEVRDRIVMMEEATGQRLVRTQRGTEGSIVTLTPEGEGLLEEYCNKKRRLEEQVDRLFGNPSLTVDGIVLVDHRLLLVRRAKDPWKGSFALPGGFVEMGERTEDCIVREVKEETGLITEPLDLVGIYSDPGRDPRGHVISAVYLLRSVGGELRAGDDAQSAQLFDMDDLPTLAFDHRRIIDEFLLSRGRS